MDNNEQNIEHQLLLKRLDDPSINKWEKAKIRKTLGIYLGLSEADFIKLHDANYATIFYDYIVDQIGRLQKQNPTFIFDNLPDSVKEIYFLWGYTSIFESGVFRDYSEMSLAQFELRNGYSLREDKRILLNGLENLGLSQDKTLLNNLWGKADEITDKEIDDLQEKFWSAEFKTDFANRLNKFIDRNKTELLTLQVY